MTLLSSLLIALVAFQHIGTLVIEMFLWQKPLGMKLFDRTPEEAAITASVAANLGLYNGFLAAGLLYGLLTPNPAVAWAMKTFFLTCVIVAALYIGLSKPRLFILQGVPALLALVVFLLTSTPPD